MVDGVAHRAVLVGESFSWPGLSLTALWPRYLIDSGSAVNNASTVLLATMASMRVLLLADVEHEAQEALTPIGRVAVVKIAHHGSGNQRLGLLDRWQPRVGVISVGAGNPYGHPHGSLLRAFAARGIPIYRTDRMGSIALAWTGGQIVIRPRGHPFWSSR
jgi:competence protein ComEC